jgi:TPR repeat protein
MSRFFKGTCLAFLIAGLFAIACRGEEAATKAPEPAAKPAAAKEKAKIPIGDAGRRLYFEKRCRDGHAGLCGELGLMWEKGYGGEKNKQKADEYYRLACDQAVLGACEAIGEELAPAKELEILDKNCAAGSAFACNNRGQILVAGREDVKADPAKALPFLEKGCSGGYASSCRSLAVVFGTGMGVAADEAKSKEYGAKAAAADAVVRALEEEYLGVLPHDKQPIGRASSYTLNLANATDAQEEELKKAKEKGAAGAAKTGKAAEGEAPKKP